MIRKIILYSLLFILIVGCNGSSTYRGKWFAMSPKGEKVHLIFKENKMYVSNGTKKGEVYSYHQNSYKIKNSIETYGIKVSNDEIYQIHFPKGNNKSIGLILDGNDQIVYTISRDHFIKPEEFN